MTTPITQAQNLLESARKSTTELYILLHYCNIEPNDHLISQLRELDNVAADLVEYINNYLQ